MFTLVLGGSGSGKSEYAEQLIEALGDRRRIYIATMKPWDGECVKRIERHRSMRAQKQFETLECYENLEHVTLTGTPGKTSIAVLLECMSNLVSNELFGTGEEEEGLKSPLSFGTRKNMAPHKILGGISRILQQAEDLVVVTNEVFSDGDDYDPMTNDYRQVLGEINRRMGAQADRVVEVTAGIPVICREGGK